MFPFLLFESVDLHRFFSKEEKIEQINLFEKKKIYQLVSKIFDQHAHHTPKKTGVKVSMKHH